MTHQCEAENLDGSRCIRRIAPADQPLCWQHRVAAESWRKPWAERLAKMADTADPTACWEWQGPRTPEGYGKVQWHRATLSAHRVSYEQAGGVIPGGFHLDHLCRNPPCVNPSHLEPTTPRENWQRSTAFTVAEAQQTHCVHGHPFDSVNTRFSRKPNGGVGRRCRSCERRRSAEYQARKRSAA